MEKVATILGMTVLAILLAVFAALLSAIPVWILWNWLMPMIFGLPKISLIQAFGLHLLAGLLFRQKTTASVSEKKR